MESKTVTIEYDKNDPKSSICYCNSDGEMLLHRVGLYGTESAPFFKNILEENFSQKSYHFVNNDFAVYFLDYSSARRFITILKLLAN